MTNRDHNIYTKLPLRFGADGKFKILQVSDFPKKPYNADCRGILSFEQLMWYRNSSVELERFAGHKVYGTMFMHIAPWEFQVAVDNPDETGLSGTTDERMSLGGVNSGLFAALLRRGIYVQSPVATAMRIPLKPSCAGSL